MPGTRDRSGKAVDLVSTRMLSVIERVREILPLGPSLTQLTPQELTRALAKMDQQKAIAYLSRLDSSDLMRVLQGGSK